jgi:hypothetical protein
MMAVINKLLTEESTANSLKIMIFTHMYLAAILILVQFGKLLLLFAASMRKGNII